MKKKNGNPNPCPRLPWFYSFARFFLNTQTLKDKGEREVVKATEISRDWDCGGSLGWRAGDKHGHLKSDV